LRAKVTNKHTERGEIQLMRRRGKERKRNREHEQFGRKKNQQELL